MYSILHNSRDNVIGIKVIHELKSEDYATLLPFTRQRILKHGAIRILTDLSEFDHPNHWANLKAALRILRYAQFVEKDAIISDDPWVLNFAKIVSPWFKTEVRVFPTTKVDEAWNWINS